jgi:hypothetical protein
VTPSTIGLHDFVPHSEGAGEIGPSDADAFLGGGLDDLLRALLTPALAEALRADDVPDGFSAAFQKGLGRPSSGGLLSLAEWVGRQGAAPASRALDSFLKAKPGRVGQWLHGLVEARNALMHPGQTSPEETRLQVAELLRNAPDLRAFGQFVVSEPSVCWVLDDLSVPLAPFAFATGTILQVFSHFEVKSGRLAFDVDEPGASDDGFREQWQRCRCRDGRLEDPTPEDIRRKASRCPPAPKAAPAPWASKALAGAPPGLLVCAGSLDALLAWSVAEETGLGIELAPQSGQSIAAAFEETLGLAKLPRPADLVALFSAECPGVIGVRTDGVGSRDLLEMLFWLAGLADVGAGERLHVVIERDAGTIKSDQLELADRLPDLSSILISPARRPGLRLPEFLWPRENRLRLWPFGR